MADAATLYGEEETAPADAEESESPQEDDVGQAKPQPLAVALSTKPKTTEPVDMIGTVPATNAVGLHYNIQIHLPATKDVEVYNAIFKSLRDHIIE